jgi:hypothetical protein
MMVVMVAVCHSDGGCDVVTAAAAAAVVEQR